LLDDKYTIDGNGGIGISNIIPRSQMASKERKNGKELWFGQLPKANQTTYPQIIVYLLDYGTCKGNEWHLLVRWDVLCRPALGGLERHAERRIGQHPQGG
jgi:hypothetical protein